MLILVRSRQLRGRRLASDDNLVWVYRCVVTPTRVCLYPPEQTTSNEALRQHNMFRDRFLRVTFADESDRIQINPTVLSADEAVPYDGTLARVRRALQFGLQIAGRHYVFLAYGASSAREHSCWFVAEDRDNDFTAKSVGTKLGFGRITENNVAKHAARMGIVSATERAQVDASPSLLPAQSMSSSTFFLISPTYSTRPSRERFASRMASVCAVNGWLVKQRKRLAPRASMPIPLPSRSGAVASKGC